MSLTDTHFYKKTRLRGLLAVCIAASGAFLSPQVVFGQDAKTQLDIAQPNTETVKQSGIANEARNFLGNTPEVEQPAVQHAIASQPSYLVSPAQDELISNLLLAFLFFVLPAGVAFAIWKQEKRDRDRNMTLHAQVEMLERIWRKNPQYPQH